MKVLALFIICFLLAGCPGKSALYLHNHSNHVITVPGVEYSTDSVTVRAGATKKVPFYLHSKNECFLFYLDETPQTFYLDRELLNNAWKAVRDGERFDIHFEYGKLFIQTRSGDWLEIARMESCNGT